LKGKDHARTIDSLPQANEEKISSGRIQKTPSECEEIEKNLPKTADYYSLLGEIVFYCKIGVVTTWFLIITDR